MHFAATLDAGVVPEWKSQYVNYREGKRLIDRLATNSPTISRLRQFTSTVRTPRTPGTPHPSRQNTRSTSTTHPAISAHDLVLPSPALPVNKAMDLEMQPPESANDGASSRSATSLFQGTPRLRGVKFTSNSPSRATATSSVRLATTNQQIDDRSPLLQAGKDRQIEYFYSWLDHEVNRANQFYASQIDDARAKMRVLKAQLVLLEEHQQQRKSEERIPRARTLFERLDLPTLPAPWRQQPQSRNGDYQTQHVSYSQAKAMLRTAMAENYHDLVQQAAFRTLNMTAIRKITKKFDKLLDVHTQAAFLDGMGKLPLAGNVVNDLLTECEHLYAKIFEDGNHKHAVERLQVGRNASLQPHNAAVLSVGLLLGSSVPLLVRALYCGIRALSYNEYETRLLLQVWGGFAIIAVMLVGMSLNTLIWHHYRINYPFIFEFDRSTTLDYRQTAVLPSLFLFGSSLFAWITFEPHSGMYRYLPCIYLGIAFVALTMPFGPYWSARKWLLHSLIRLILSGLYAVEFRDFFLGDLTSSLNYSVSNIDFFFCIYTVENWWDPPNANHCGSTHSRAMGFLNCLPAIWRWLQCLRRFADTFDWFPHLLNLGKYTSVVMYNMTLSLARIEAGERYKIVFAVFAAVNGVYTALWDIFMDFSLGPNLRAILVYPRWCYYFVMILDAVMRQTWILYIIWWSERPQSAKISFIVALIEASRRVIWACFRVENEHTANIARNRAFKDLSLPYDDIAESVAEARVPEGIAELTADADGQVTQSAPQSITPRLQRHFTYGSSPAMAALSVAHVRDFQRRETEEDSEED